MQEYWSRLKAAIASAKVARPNAIYVKLVSSDNMHLSYPCHGLLDITETSATGGIVVATFNRIYLALEDNAYRIDCPVVVTDPCFSYATLRVTPTTDEDKT